MVAASLETLKQGRPGKDANLHVLASREDAARDGRGALGEFARRSAGGLCKVGKFADLLSAASRRDDEGQRAQRPHMAVA